MVSDQNASFGGSPPGGKRRRYWFRPFSPRPAPTAEVVQYIASSGTFTGPGNIWAHAARKNMPLPGTPHPYRVTQPLTFVALIHAKSWADANASPAPIRTPCTRSFRTVRV